MSKASSLQQVHYIYTYIVSSGQIHDMSHNCPEIEHMLKPLLGLFWGLLFLMIK